MIFTEHYTAQNPKYRTVIPELGLDFLPGIKAQIYELTGHLAHSSLRIWQIMNTNIGENQYHPLALNAVDLTSQSTNSAFATDRPEQILDADQPLYTVTSSLALHSLLNGNGISSASNLELGSVHETHQGAWLTYFPVICEAFGINIEQASNYVWLAQKPEAEHLRHIEIRNQSHSKSTQSVHELFFKRHTRAGHPKIRPELAQILTHLQKHENPSANPQLRDYVDLLLQTSTQFGVRGTWYSILEGVLRGTRHPSQVWEPSMLSHMLFIRDIEFKRVHQPVDFSPIILQVDARKMFSSMPIYLFPITSRPIGPITGSRLVLPNAIDCLYAVNPSHIPGEVRQKYDVRPINIFPQQTWLSDGNGRPVTYNDVKDKTNFDPKTPTCITRYQTDPVSDAVRLLNEGTVSSYHERYYQGEQLIKPRSILERVMRRYFQEGLKISDDEFTKVFNFALIHIPGTYNYKLD